MELEYKFQNYAWGKYGSKSKVAKLYANVNPKFKIDEKEPYAELWIGTHVNAPSTVKSTGTPLATVIEKNPKYVGEEVLKHFGPHLPFLFKILSVNTALSIQAHPNKRHAQELNIKRPDLYKDPNHKPEMAIALTEFEALCGFRPLAEIYRFLTNIPQLKNIVGSDVIAKYKEGNVELLKIAFRAVLMAPKNVIAHELGALLKRFADMQESQRQAECADLIERLYSQFPNDVGCFVVYFLNYLKLKPGQALYLGANEPHAYISGDCVECMACSDNVVRAGLTPKFIDVETLCSMLTYKDESPANILFKPIIEDEFTRLFKPPVPDFAIIETKVPVTVNNFTKKAKESASTLLVIEGKAKYEDIVLQPGTAVFIPANTAIEITDITENLLMYEGLANV